MTRLPKTYVAVLGLLAAVGVLATLVFLGVPPFDNVQIFILGNVVAFFILLVLGVVGGAFVGMLLAHRILGNREFTPFERHVLETLEEVRDRLDRVEGRQRGLEEEPRLGR